MLETFFIVVLSFWLFGLIIRWLLRRWIAKKQREFSERFGGGQFGGTGSASRSGTGSARRNNNNKEGEISVHQTAPVEKKVSKAVGDYVEFEEIEITEETNCKE